MERYPNISDHGLIGDLHTAALVSMDGTVDWFCCPRFDSPSAFDEGTFSLCTFWYVDALARSGRVDDARLVFEKMHTYANPLGLYFEEIGSTGEQLGNFPQAFSHLALITAAVNLDYQLDHGVGILPKPVN